eukprot:TRINITY_DN10789_c0_g1_i1.p1 TRINITY_DN10789_c0_g1~~TRINITY_DN10789_c0_g1_i1.p1  ORF type:complete len:471 (+),score=98.13 TRINITY_DN10789_c0_g1_i1:186-1598(+)
MEAPLKKRRLRLNNISPEDVIDLEELLIIGCGLETSRDSIADLFITARAGLPDHVAVVRDLFDRSHERRYLSSILHVLSPATLFINSGVYGSDNINRRLVTQYTRDEDTGEYHVTLLDVELGVYLSSVGFVLIAGEDYDSYQVDLGNLVTEANLHFDDSHRPYELLCNGKARHTTNNVMMIPPIGFQSNIETIEDNHFMQVSDSTPQEIERSAMKEFSNFHLNMVECGIKVYLFEPNTDAPDSTFCNNWITTHGYESSMVLYPLKAESRRRERKESIINILKGAYREVISFEDYENRDLILEGTGSLVLDRMNKIAYAVLSERCHKSILMDWASKMGYELCFFKSVDMEGRPIYHTNVMMSVGTSLAVVCFDSIPNEDDQNTLRSKLQDHGYRVIDITLEQMNEFCGNIIEVQGYHESKVLCMSTRAYNAFSNEQKIQMMKEVDEILHVDIPTIENIGGGGVRCCICELF